MQRARRLASIAVVASLTVGGLSACRSEPSVAAYIGATGRITEERVQAVWDNAFAAVRDQGTAAPAEPAGAPEQPTPSATSTTLPITRGEIVRTLVSGDILAEVAKRESVTLPAELPLGDYATQLRLPQTAEYVRLYAESDALIRALRTKVQATAPDPTDADLRQVYDVLIAAQEIPADTTFEVFKQQLPPENLQLVKTATAVRNEVAEVTDTMKVTVNPRYQPLGIPVLEFQTQNGALRPLVVVPLGTTKSADPVTDIS